MKNSLNDIIQKFFDWCSPWLTNNNLIVYTIAIGILLITLLFFTLFKKGYRDYFYSTTLGLLALVLALTTSYNILFTSLDIETYKFLTFLNPTILFLINVFVRILILFWIFGIVYGFLKPGQIEVGIKIFGVELSHKYSQEDVYKAKIGHDKLKNQLSIIDDLTKEGIEYLSTPFESRILLSDKKYDIIRDEVKAILTEVYLKCPNSKIEVLPLIEEKLLSLPEPLGSIVRKMNRESNEEDTIDVIEDIYGIGLLYGKNDLSALIIIDVSNTVNYELSRSEINCACILYNSISSIISLAKNKEHKDQEGLK